MLCLDAGGQGARDVCAFNAHWKVDAFEKQFAGQFREHMFRYNPLVPQELRLDVSIESPDAQGRGGGQGVPTVYLRQQHAQWAPPGASMLVVPDSQSPVRAAAIAQLLESYNTARVVHIVALYDLSITLEPADETAFEEVWKRALVAGTVRQYD